jgi:2-keto-4-pentenoate hydratase/2-oxohepta-3-ene-1,7-dioic acid hydratase in catechol pathway
MIASISFPDRASISFPVPLFIRFIKWRKKLMKLLFYNDYRLGVLKQDSVVDIYDIVKSIPHTGPHNLINGLIERFDEFKSSIEKRRNSGEGVPLKNVKIRPPLPKPVNIDCMAVNYIEDPTRPEPAPINAFQKSPRAIIGDGDTMILPDVPATIFEGEAELAVIIGKQASSVKASDAMSYVFGYINFIDGSARGLPPPGNVFYQMKSIDTFAPIGPFLVTADEVSNPDNLQIKLWNNGRLMQDYNTRDMAHKIPRCIEWITSIHTLEPGDIVATGTNHKGLNPYMDGDLIEMEVEGMGRLHFFVRDDLKRTWARETRGERQMKHLEGTTPQLTGKYSQSKQ